MKNVKNIKIISIIYLGHNDTLQSIISNEWRTIYINEADDKLQNKINLWDEKSLRQEIYIFF